VPRNREHEARNQDPSQRALSQIVNGLHGSFVLFVCSCSISPGIHGKRLDVGVACTCLFLLTCSCLSVHLRMICDIFNSFVFPNTLVHSVVIYVFLSRDSHMKSRDSHMKRHGNVVPCTLRVHERESICMLEDVLTCSMWLPTFIYE
jgi:hypothetical protein